MIRKLAIVLICVSVVGVLLGLAPPSYERTQTAFSLMSPNSNAITDDFSNIGMMFTIMRRRLTMDPQNDTLDLIVSTSSVNDYAWTVTFIDRKDDGSVVMEYDTFNFSSVDARAEAYFLTQYLFDIPQYGGDGFFSDVANFYSNLLIIVTSIFAFAGCFVFVFVDIISITYGFVRGVLYFVGFSV